MPTNLCLVANAPQGLPNKGSVRGPSNRARQGGLSDTGRANKTKNRSLDLLDKAGHGEVVKDSLLHLFETVVVFVQHLGRMTELQVLFR